MLTRRNALKAMAGALAAFVLPAPRRHIDLTAFCSRRNRGRYDLRLPYCLEDYTYATDARVCVRVRPESADVALHTGPVPPFGGLSWDHDRLRGWRPLPSLPALLADDSNCPACDGMGYPGACAQDCERCAGTGVVWVGSNWDLSEARTCRECQGTGAQAPGVPPCSFCGGKAVGRFPALVCLEGRYFDAALYEKLRELGAEFVHDNWHATPSYPLLKVRCAAGDGLLLGVEHSAAERRRPA